MSVARRVRIRVSHSFLIVLSVVSSNEVLSVWSSDSCLQWESVGPCSESFQSIVQEVWVSASVFQIDRRRGAEWRRVIMRGASCPLGRFV